MPLKFVPVTSLAPGGEHGEGMLRVENVVPALGGLRSLPKATSTGTLGGRITSCYIHHWPSGSGSSPYSGDAATELYGTGSGIYEFSGGAFNLISAAFVLPNPATWRFASFANDIWATDYNNAVQRRTNNAGNFAAGITSAFVPRGRFIGTVRDFLVLADIPNASYGPNWFCWSDFRDATYFSPPDATRPSSLAGAQPILSRPGQIMGFVGGEYGIFWKRNSMHALSFIGGDDVFRLDEISRSVGTPCPGSIVSCRDGYNRFWGGDGFYQQTAYSPPEKIGGEEIASLLIDRDSYANDMSLRPMASFNDMAEEDLTMFAAEDPEMGGVFWFYRGEADDPLDGNKRWVFHNYVTGAWVTGAVSGISFTSASANRSFLSSSNRPPRFVVGTTFDNVASEGYRFQFQDTTHYAMTLATKRFWFAAEQAQANHQVVAVRAIQPVVTPAQSSLSTYQLAAVPDALTVKIFAANDAHFEAQTDPLGDTISPRSATLTYADANDFGWMGAGGIQGQTFLLEASLAESTTALRNLLGFWVDYEVVR